MDAITLRARIRHMVKTGEIPCEEPVGSWAGNGDGRRCSACGERVAPDEVEFEVDLPSGATIRLHRRCHAIWMEECDAVES
jgi:hypothetical protein